MQQSASAIGFELTCQTLTQLMARRKSMTLSLPGFSLFIDPKFSHKFGNQICWWNGWNYCKMITRVNNHPSFPYIYINCYIITFNMSHSFVILERENIFQFEKNKKTAFLCYNCCTNPTHYDLSKHCQVSKNNRTPYTFMDFLWDTDWLNVFWEFFCCQNDISQWGKQEKRTLSTHT